jgi:hypothetical protein
MIKKYDIFLLMVLMPMGLGKHFNANYRPFCFAGLIRIGEMMQQSQLICKKPIKFYNF